MMLSLMILLTTGLFSVSPNGMSESRDAVVCPLVDPDPPAYYRIDLVPTGRVPGTRQARAYGEVVFKASPFAVTVTPEGSYDYDLAIRISDVGYKGDGVFVAWLTTSDLKQIRRLGVLDRDLSIKGSVAWNKFLVVVTLESTDEPMDRWRGPVVFRGISRSGLMHTMAGHGPFSREPCASYGY